MLKRVATLLFAIIIAVSCIGNHTFADNVSVPSGLNEITSKYALLYEANSGSVLFDKNGSQMAYPASTTKVLTAIIIIDLCEGNFLLGDIYQYFKENGDSWVIPEGYNERNFTLSQSIVVESVETKGSTLIPCISEREVMNLNDMLYGMMLVSGNDCARALARHFSPDNELGGFAKLMNGYCKELGATNSTFNVPHGLHIEDKLNETTAYDMAVITAYALKNETFRKIVSTETYTIPATNMHDARIIENTNRLIHQKADDTESFLYPYAIGVKTGDTAMAGRCLIAAAEKNGMQLIAVLFGDFDDTTRIGTPRYANAKLLFEYGFNNFSLIAASQLNIKKDFDYTISDADIDGVKLKADVQNVSVCVDNQKLGEYRQNAKDFTYRIVITTPDGKLHAPLNTNEKVGIVEYTYNNKVVLKTDLLSAANVEESDGRSKTGVTKQELKPLELTGYEWIFWVALASLLCVIFIVILALVKQPVKRRNSQLRRRKSRR